MTSHLDASTANDILGNPAATLHPPQSSSSLRHKGTHEWLRARFTLTSSVGDYPIKYDLTLQLDENGFYAAEGDVDDLEGAVTSPEVQSSAFQLAAALAEAPDTAIGSERISIERFFWDMRMTSQLLNASRRAAE